MQHSMYVVGKFNKFKIQISLPKVGGIFNMTSSLIFLGCYISVYPLETSMHYDYYTCHCNIFCWMHTLICGAWSEFPFLVMHQHDYHNHRHHIQGQGIVVQLPRLMIHVFHTWYTWWYTCFCVAFCVVFQYNHTDLKYTGCLDFSPYGCYRRFQFLYIFM
jgi:hypothetical protein